MKETDSGEKQQESTKTKDQVSENQMQDKKVDLASVGSCSEEVDIFMPKGKSAQKSSFPEDIAEDAEQSATRRGHKSGKDSGKKPQGDTPPKHKDTSADDLDNAFKTNNPEKFYSAAFNYINMHPNDPFVKLDGKQYAIIPNQTNGAIALVPFSELSRGSQNGQATSYMMHLDGNYQQGNYYVYAPGANGRIQCSEQTVHNSSDVSQPGYTITVYNDGRPPIGGPSVVPRNF